jgi:hypothetical protein
MPRRFLCGQAAMRSWMRSAPYRPRCGVAESTSFTASPQSGTLISSTTPSSCSQASTPGMDHGHYWRHPAHRRHLAPGRWWLRPGDRNHRRHDRGVRVAAVRRRNPPLVVAGQLRALHLRPAPPHHFRRGNAGGSLAGLSRPDNRRVTAANHGRGIAARTRTQSPRPRAPNARERVHLSRATATPRSRTAPQPLHGAGRRDRALRPHAGGQLRHAAQLPRLNAETNAALNEVPPVVANPRYGPLGGYRSSRHRQTSSASNLRRRPQQREADQRPFDQLG